MLPKNFHTQLLTIALLGKLGTLSTKDREAVLGKLKDYMLGD